MSGKPPRPILKLKVSQSGLAGVTGSPQAETPSGTKKIKLKLGGAQATQNDTPTSASIASPKINLKPPAKPKPQRPRIKTTKDKGGDDADTPTGGPKRIRLKTTAKTPTTPYIKLKSGGNRPIQRPRGQAYDEIASDREDDPLIEEDFILRMMPGEDCDYVRQACEKRTWGPRQKGGADVRLRFLTTDGRRGILTVRGKMYACALVDMPCIVEGMKSWDKKSWYKSADIFQMLLVLGVIQNENEAMDYPLPEKDVEKKTMAYAHGLTPPMRWVRKRRFRKRISLKTIEAVEAEVERLLEMDEQAEEPTKYDLFDPDKMSRGHSGQDTPRSDDEYEEIEVDADGEEVEMEDYFDDAIVEEDEDALAAQFELAMQEGEGDIEAETPAASSTAAAEAHNVTGSEAGTPAAGHISRDDESGDDSDDDEDLDDMDDDAREQRADLKRQREEIADLESAIRSQTSEMEGITNAILKKKKAEKIQSLKEELELKKAGIGEGEDD